MTENYKELSRVLRAKLKSSGFDYEISHSRIMCGYSAIDENGNLDNVLSRPEFSSSLISKNCRFEKRCNCDHVLYGHYVAPYGGFTRVSVTSPNGNIAVGKHNFGAHTHFNKATGTFKALCKALSKINGGVDLINDAIDEVKNLETA